MIDFLAANWLWILLIGAFVLMHTRGGGCGMHGSHGHGGHQDHRESGRTEHRGCGMHGSHGSSRETPERHWDEQPAQRGHDRAA